MTGGRPGAGKRGTRSYSLMGKESVEMKVMKKMGNSGGYTTL